MAEKKPFDWNAFLTWLENNSSLLFQIVRILFKIGMKKAALKVAGKKVQEFEVYIASNNFNKFKTKKDMSKTKIASKEKPISDLLKAGLMIALNFIENTLTKRIENEIVDESIVRTIARLKQVTTVLNDNDPNNKAQTLAILRSFVKEDITEVVYQILLQEIDKIKDEDIRIVAIFVLDNAVNIVNILTDEDADNATQFKNFLNYLRYDEATQNLLADHILDPLLEKINVSEELRGIIIDFILKAIAGDASKTTELTASLKVL